MNKVPASSDAVPQVSITALRLTDFRSHASLSLSLDHRHVVLFGENGAGKTNILEAVSLLSPGRGFRRATYAEMAAKGTEGFAIHAGVESAMGAAEIGTGTIAGGALGSVGAGGEGGRRVRINGASESADAMAEWLRVIWLLPAMDGLFTGSASDRRRFLDRMVLAIDPSHGRRALAYEKAMRQRNRLFADDVRDDLWYESVETELAEAGLPIMTARRQLVEALQRQIDRLPEPSPFPKSDLSLLPGFEDDMPDTPEAYRAALARGRYRDRMAGRALAGPHRGDLLVEHRPKAMAAKLCSTGEQKALLIGLILAHARLTATQSGMAPILLLDEVAAHLDAGRRAALFDILDELGGQAWMTGTDGHLFAALADRAQFFHLSNGTVQPAKGPPPMETDE
ncbi:DNA replication/repair protein RecF [Notoacmeibacter sp. MSK16QG-6]|uniref:DNA replication/repair protein RecF n=1 Tax=Notoacmeibacter sp. MSK16QG-6 TaxID=2957982 RepID=UPI00209DEB06|nr:DNA replication/repair protein RecF [Notoacmeibacter sp. MSK16QG-6]MCP1198778.1 DNA replication/repair protein RecF [Notoacmeibacter sp. MSK16QG-6]